MGIGITEGNVFGHYLIKTTLSPVEVAANTTAEQTFTLSPTPGLKTTDFVSVMKPTAQAGLGIVGARVSATNTLAITFVNATGTPITPTASQVYVVDVVRPEANVPATLISE
jgi:hypothetical protein